MVVNLDCAVVKTGQDPWFRRIEIRSFDSVRPGEFPLLVSESSAEDKGEEGSIAYVDIEEHF